MCGSSALNKPSSDSCRPLLSQYWGCSPLRTNYRCSFSFSATVEPPGFLYVTFAAVNCHSFLRLLLLRLSTVPPVPARDLQVGVSKGSVCQYEAGHCSHCVRLDPPENTSLHTANECRCQLAIGGGASVWASMLSRVQ